MKLRIVTVCGIAGLFLAGGKLLAADNNVSGPVAATAAVYVPDTSHQSEPLPEGVLAWNSLMQEISVSADAGTAHFTFSFTNIATIADLTQVTNITESATNITVITNSKPCTVAILDVHPSCGCTTAQLPPLPWIISPGTSGEFGLTVNLAGKTGTLFKTANVKTDKGFKQLILKITIQPPVVPTQSAADRTRAMILAKADRQAIFHGDCVACHVKPGDGKYGQTLYAAVCGICHEAKDRASMVPDLHNIKTKTNLDFWQTWIAHGKAGSLMPAFCTSDGGPLSDMQITSLAQYLAATIPSQSTGTK